MHKGQAEHLQSHKRFWRRVNGEMKYLETCARTGNVTPRWAELKAETKDNSRYTSDLYTDSNRTKTSPNCIIANLTRYIYINLSIVITPPMPTLTRAT